LALTRDARTIHDLTGLPTRPLALAACDAVELASALRCLPVDVGVVFLAHTDPDRARTARGLLRQARRLPVVTDQDTIAIALTAAVLTTLTRRGIAPAAARALIAGAGNLPPLRPLLASCGVGDIVSWNDADAVDFPLRRVARNIHVAVDLRPTPAHPPVEGDLVVVTPGDPDCRLLALPGLLRTLTRTPVPVADAELHRACVFTLAACIPPGRTLPDLATVKNAARAAAHAPSHTRDAPPSPSLRTAPDPK
jgi:malate dehydrogenase (oxaloacetate-decarboxylating)